MNRLSVLCQVTLLIGVVMVSWKSSPAFAEQAFPQKPRALTAYGAILADYFTDDELPPVLSALDKVSLTLKITKVSPMQGGYSTRVFRVETTSDQVLVLRVLPKRESSQDFSKEIYASIENAKKGNAPKIFYADSQNGILVMEFLEGQILRDSIYVDTQNKIINIAKLLKQSHSIPAQSLTSYNIYHRIYDTVLGMSAPLPKRLLKLIEAVKSIESEPNLNEKVPCHNDLNPNNIMDSDGELWLIDWEMAGLNDPMYDLATVSNFLIPDPTLQHELLKAYFGKAPNGQQLDRFAKMRLVSLTFYGTILQKIAQDPMFFKFDQLDKELSPLSKLYELRLIWNQFNDSRSLSLFGLSLLAEAEKIAANLKLP